MSDILRASDLSREKEDEFLVAYIEAVASNVDAEPTRTGAEALRKLGAADRVQIVDLSLQQCDRLREESVSDSVFALELSEAVAKDNGQPFAGDDTLSVAVAFLCPSQADKLVEVLREFIPAR